MKISVKHFKGGSGRSLCRPTRVGTTDGPFRQRRFYLKPIRPDHENVLIQGNTKKLVKAAYSVIDFPSKEQSENFWKTFRHRVFESTHSIEPYELPPILTALSYKDIAPFNTSISEEIVPNIQKKINKIDGITLYEVLKFTCKYLPFSRSPIFYLSLRNRLPYTLYQLTVHQTLEALKGFETAGYTDSSLCHIVEDKIQAQIAYHDASTLALASQVFSSFNYRSINIFSTISKLSPQKKFEAGDLISLLAGYQKLQLDCQDLITTLKPQINSHFTSFKSSERQLLNSIFQQNKLEKPF